jgi:predicted Zn-dependent protease
MKYILLLISQIIGYKILDYATPSKEQNFKFCPLIDKRVIDDVFEITNDVRATTNYNFIYKNDVNTKLTICNGNLLDGETAYTKTFRNNTKEIHIDNELLTYDYNLYNVLYHEMGHAIGMAHSDNKGVMNYSLVNDKNDNIVDDTFKIWLSQDDVNGIKFLQK